MTSLEPESLSKNIADGALVMARLLRHKKGLSISDLSTDRTLYEEFNRDFPICRVSHERFLHFLTFLEKEVAATNSATILAIERTLEKTSDGFEPTLTVRFARGRTQLRATEFSAQMGVPAKHLPSRGQGAFFCEGRQLTGLQFHTDDEECKVTLTPRDTLIRRGTKALQAVRIDFRARGQDPVSIPKLPQGAMGLSTDEPILYVPVPDHPNRWRFAGTGAVNVAGKEALLLIGPQDRIEPEDRTENHPAAALPELAGEITDVGRIYRITTPVRVVTQDAVYKIRFRHGTNDIYVWEGNLLGETAEGTPIYRGFPTLRRHGEHAVDLVRPEWRLNGRHVTASGEPTRAVFLTACVRDPEDGSAMLKRLKVLVLPNDAQWTHRVVKSSAGTSTVTLHRWGLGTVSVAQPSEARIDEDIDSGSHIVCCPKQSASDAMRPTELTLSCSTKDGHVFKLVCDYPAYSVDFIWKGERLREMAELTLTDVRDLVIRAYAPGDESIELQIRPSGQAQPDECLSLRIPINPASNLGILTYEDFRSALFRVARLLARTDRSIEMSIREVGHTRIVVNQHHSILNICTPARGGLNLRSSTPGTEENSPRPPRKIRLEPLYSAFDAKELLEPIDITITPPFWAPVPDCIFETHTPWFAWDPNDPHYTLRPVTIATTPPSASFGLPLSRMTNVWRSAPLPDEEFEILSLFEQDFSKIDAPQWSASIDIIRRIGLRGFALLPFWGAFRHNVPLAFSYAAVVDILYEAPYGRTFLFELGRTRNWRWELISLPSLQKAVRRIVGLFKLWGLGSMFDELFTNRVLDRIRDDLSPGLRQKLLFALWTSGIISDPKRLMEGLSDGLPDQAVPPFLLIENCSSQEDFLRRLQEEARRMMTFYEPSNTNENQAYRDVRILLEPLKKHRPKLFEFALETSQRFSSAFNYRKSAEAAFIAALLWSGLDSESVPPETETAEQAENRAFRSEISTKDFFFRTENALAALPEWTAWCHAAAAVAASRLADY